MRTAFLALLVALSAQLGPAAGRAEATAAPDAPAAERAEGAPDILVIGDSQLSFGAGEAFVDLLGHMAGSCGLAPGATTGVIGVRSSSVVSWTGRSRQEKAAICDVDPKWKVNAGAYGTLAQPDRTYVQIGRDPRGQFRFCAPDRSPLQAVFADGYYDPGLLILFLMGNAAQRWAASPDAALQDARALAADLPPGLPCVFMTSAPTYGAREVALRSRAQDNIARALAMTGHRCTFVAGFTPATIRANMGNAAHFRRHASGRVKDPFHPTGAAAERFLSLRQPALCAAIAGQMARAAARRPTAGAAPLANALPYSIAPIATPASAATAPARNHGSALKGGFGASDAGTAGLSSRASTSPGSFGPKRAITSAVRARSRSSAFGPTFSAM